MEPTVAPDWLSVFNVVALILFTGAIVVGAITTTTRLVRYWLAGEKPPLLLWRDVVARLSLAGPFAAILLVRALDALGFQTAARLNNPWWIVPTSSFAVFGALLYAYFEIFVIEARTGSDQEAATSEHGPPPPQARDP